MYLTIKTAVKEKQLTFEDLLANPFMLSNMVPSGKAKTVTVKITEEYGQELYNKRNVVHSWIPGSPWTLPYEEIPQHYRQFTIPKKTDPRKRRTINAPSDVLKSIQTHYKCYIEDYLGVLVHKNAGAYVKKKSIVDSMESHQKNDSNWYLQIDLKDFFPSINEAFLRKQLALVYPFKFIPEEMLEPIIKYSLLNDELPQGSCLSPTLTNVLMVPIDHEITERLHNFNNHHFVYTRYADDITISCKEHFDYNQILDVILGVFEEFEAPFTINTSKTRYGSRAGKNYHLGLIVNKDNKISIGHEKNNKFRAMLYNFIQVGDTWEIKDVQRMLGLISYYKSVEPDFVNKTIRRYNEKYNVDILAKAKERINGR